MSFKSKIHVLKFGSLNINGGMVDKSNETDFCNLVYQFDILCVKEAWLTDAQLFNINGYKYS